MSLIILNVDEVRRTLSVSDASAFVVNDKNVDVVRFALLTGFTDIALDEHSALRVMYQRPGETQVRAQTLTYYDTDGIRKYYDWELIAADLAEKGTLNCALCILRTDSEVEEWHTTPYQIKVLGSIHTDDSDEADETITPTVAQRVAVLESMIQRVASGAPIVVASTSAMTDTEQIYVLSTNGNWYYHNGSAWVAGGEYGGVTAGSITTNKLADGSVTTAKLADGAVAAGKIASDVIANLKEDSRQSYEMVFGGSALALPTETVTRNGVTFTATSAGITANGTATVNAIFGIDFTVLKSGNYRLSGCPSGGSSTKFYQRINGISGMDTGSGVIVELTERTNYSLWIVIVKGKTVDNITFSTSLVFDEISLKSLNTSLSYKLDIGHYDLETERGINLVSGSLQTLTMGVATAIQGIACTKKIPVNPNETIEIFVPKIDDDTVEYTYRFGQYRENGTYKSQIEATASNKLTIASDCYYFSFGAYAKKDGQAIAYSFFEALKDKAPVAVIFTDRPKEDYTSKAQVQSMIDKSIFANTDINYLNQNLKNVLIQAKRPMNLSGNAYLSQIQPVALLHFSDIHGDYVELSRMVKFKTEYANYLDDTICTGDIVEARWANDFNFWGNTEGTDDILLAIGNHDVLTAPYPSWDWSQRATQQEQYDRYFAPFIANWGCQYTAGLTYYYKDYTEKKLRLIVLNCMLTAEDEAGQLTWFVNTLENARTNDLSVVVVNHFPLPDPVKVDCNFTSIDKAYGNTDILPIHYLSAINDFITAGGKFVCHIAGHTHTDYVVKSTAYPNQIMIIVDALSRNQGNQYSDTQRANDTRSQDLANVIVFDTSSKNIKIMRVGANMDHHLRAKNYITINYNTGAIITSN